MSSKRAKFAFVMIAITIGSVFCVLAASIFSNEQNVKNKHVTESYNYGDFNLNYFNTNGGSFWISIETDASIYLSNSKVNLCISFDSIDGFSPPASLISVHLNTKGLFKYNNVDHINLSANSNMIFNRCEGYSSEFYIYDIFKAKGKPDVFSSRRHVVTGFAFFDDGSVLEFTICFNVNVHF